MCCSEGSDLRLTSLDSHFLPVSDAISSAREKSASFITARAREGNLSFNCEKRHSLKSDWAKMDCSSLN